MDLEGKSLSTNDLHLHRFNFPGVYRQNNVPAWQRLHQQHDGIRQWNKGPRAKFMLYPYYGN